MPESTILYTFVKIAKTLQTPINNVILATFKSLKGDKIIMSNQYWTNATVVKTNAEIEHKSHFRQQVSKDLKTTINPFQEISLKSDVKKDPGWRDPLALPPTLHFLVLLGLAHRRKPLD